MPVIVVLDDGETYSAMDGCVIAVVSDEDLQKLENEDCKYRDLDNVISEVKLREE